LSARVSGSAGAGAALNIPIGSSLSLLWRYLLPHKRRMAVLFALLFANIGLQLVNPQILRHFIDAASASASAAATTPGALAWIAGLFAGTAVLGNIASGLASYVGEDVAWSATNALRADLARHTLGLDMSFHKAHTAGEMIERIDGDVTALSNFFSQFVVKVAGTFVLMAGVLAAMYIEDWRIGATMTLYALLVLLVLLAVHPLLAVTSLLAAASIALIAWLTDRATRAPLAQANIDLARAQQAVGATLRSASLVQALGMAPALEKRWQEHHQAYLGQQAGASLSAGRGQALSKFVQTLQSSLLLGLGCWLTLEGQLPASGSMMIVASILGARALAPLTQVVTQWRQIVQVSLQWQQLRRSLALPLPEQSQLPLPAPQGQLRAEQVSHGLPSGQVLLRNLNFALAPGSVLMVMGASGAGKTTLARLLVGLLPATQGKVRLDGMDVQRWNKDELGPFVGYLPQSIELLEGTVAENIARFGAPDAQRLDDAVDLAGLRELLDSLPQGLAAQVGVQGTFLSGGMRQRIALARAVYGRPRLVVLDEPNSHLDAEGEAALARCLQQLRADGCTVVVISHRSSVLQAATHLMILREGHMQACGPRDEVIAALKKAMAQPGGAREGRA